MGIIAVITLIRRLNEAVGDVLITNHVALLHWANYSLLMIGDGGGGGR
jgi:hypothetical protein